MEKLLIEGGVPLSGTIVPAGNKNAALPLLACSLLTDEQVVLHNVPRIRDVEAMLDLLADLTSTPSAPSAPPSSTVRTSASWRTTAASSPATSSWTSRP
jgi:UDP-N-acetylglucosamine enolpyruvyl transferase